MLPSRSLQSGGRVGIAWLGIPDLISGLTTAAPVVDVRFGQCGYFRSATNSCHADWEDRAGWPPWKVSFAGFVGVIGQLTGSHGGFPLVPRRPQRISTLARALPVSSYRTGPQFLKSVVRGNEHSRFRHVQEFGRRARLMGAFIRQMQHVTDQSCRWPGGRRMGQAGGGF